MAQLHITRVKREFREIVGSEEVSAMMNVIVLRRFPPTIKNWWWASNGKGSFDDVFTQSYPLGST